MAERGRTLAMGQDERTDKRPQASKRRSAMRSRHWRRSRPDIVGLTADLGKYTDILPFRDAFPDRFFNVGMAEQNLVAVAAGLARTGLHAYCTTYGVFATSTRLRFHRHRLRAQRGQREDLRRPARPDDRLRRHASGDRGSGPDADDPGPCRHRSLRRDRDRPGDGGRRRPRGAGLRPAAARQCAGRARSRRATASRSAARKLPARGARTSASSRPVS